MTGSNSQCIQCFSGYTLSNSNCVIDASCSSSNTCKYCPYGYYLQNSSCLSCPSLPNCLTCNSNLQCTLCSKGYYLNGATCSACSSSCLECSSLTFCSLAADGYYLQYSIDASNSGVTLPCQSPCLICDSSSTFCLACISGYNISGSTCLSNALLVASIVIGAGNSASSIFLNTDTDSVKLLKAIQSVNRILVSVCLSLPSFLKATDPSCQKLLRVSSFSLVASSRLLNSVDAVGSTSTNGIGVNLQINANGVTDPVATVSTMTQNLNSNGIDGASIVKVSISSQNIP